MTEWKDHGTVSTFLSTALVTRILPLLAESKVLDIGCGDGTILSRLSSKSIGLDYDANSIQLCLNRKLNAIQHEVGGRLPFEEGVFDTVFASHVIEHIESPIDFMREALRVSKADLRLILGVPNPNWLAHKIFPKRLAYFQRTNHHLHAITYKQMEVWIEHLGLRKIFVYPDIDAVMIRNMGLSGLASKFDVLPFGIRDKLVYTYWFGIGSR